MSDLDFADVNVDDAVELQTVQNGWSGELEITGVQPNAEKSYILVICSVPGEEFTQSVRHFLFYPKPDDDKDKVNNKKLRIKEFFEAFNINGDDRKEPENWIGLSAKAILKIEAAEPDSQYGDSNQVTKWL